MYGLGSPGNVNRRRILIKTVCRGDRPGVQRSAVIMWTIRGHSKLISVLLQATVGLLLLNISEQEHIKENCNQVIGDVTYCNYLYTNENGVTWDTAAEKCSENNKTLAVINNEIRKTVAKELVAELGMLDEKIWIGGRRSEDNTWKYIDNHKTEMLNGDFPSRRYCAMRQKLSEGPSSTSCVESHLALCQYPPGPNTVCAEEGILYNEDDVCLKSSEVTMTWFEARNYCKNVNAEGDLSVISANLLFMETSMSGYWIGLQRRPWIWTPDKTPIDKFMFDAGEGSDQDQSCLALVHSEDGATLWSDIPCDDNLRYYMCETESLTTVDEVSAASETGEDNTMTTVYIFVGVILAAICLTVPIVVLIFVRRLSQRKRDVEDKEAEKTTKAESNAGNKTELAVRPEISQPIPMQAPFRVSGYDNLGVLIPIKSDPSGSNHLTETGETFLDGATCASKVPNRIILENGDQYAMVGKTDRNRSDSPIYSNVNH